MSVTPAPSPTMVAENVSRVFMPTIGIGNYPEGQIFASVAGEDADATTLAFGCPDTLGDIGFASVPECYQLSLYAATVGPSTFAASTNAYADGPISTIDINVNCEITGTMAATCTGTSVGPSSFLDEKVTTTATDAATLIETTTFGPDDMPFEDVTMVSTFWTAIVDGKPYDPAVCAGETGGCSAKDPEESAAAASKTSEDSPAATIAGKSGASHLRLGFSGTLVGALSLAMLLL